MTPAPKLDPFAAPWTTTFTLDNITNVHHSMMVNSDCESVGSARSFSPSSGTALRNAADDSSAPKLQTLATGRPYPLVERRSFRDVSSVALEEASEGGPSASSSGGTGAPERSLTPEPRRVATPSPGAIGDGRRRGGPLPVSSRATEEMDPTAPLSATTSSSHFSNDPVGPTLHPTASLTSTLLCDSIAVASQPSRSASPNPSSHHSLGGSIFNPVEALASRVSSLEATVSGLSALIQTEVRSLQEEVGVLRGLVLQSTTATSAGPSPSFPQSYFQPHAPGQPSRDATSMRERERERDLAGSPLLVLRSPSPPFASAGFPPAGQGHYSARSAYPQQQQPTFLGPASAASGGLDHRAAEERSRQLAISNDKDEQIRTLTAQLSSISASVAHLIGTPVISPHHNLSLSPVLRRGNLAQSPSVSPNLGISDGGWGRESVSSPALGISSAHLPPLVVQGRGTPVLRPLGPAVVPRNGNASPAQGSAGFVSYPREGDRRSGMSFGAVGSDAGTARRDVRHLILLLLLNGRLR